MSLYSIEFESSEEDGDQCPPNMGTIILQCPKPKRHVKTDPVKIHTKTSKTADTHTSVENKRSDYISYKIVCKKKLKINGMRKFFSFFRDDTLLYTAKWKSKASTEIVISTNPTPHLSGQAEAILLIGNDFKDFSLREKNKHGTEILTNRFFNSENHRNMAVTFFNMNSNGDLSLYSTRNRDFNGREIVPSIKNETLAELKQNIISIYIWKSAKNTLNIDAKPNFNVCDLFAIAISSFVCPIH